MSKVDIEVVNPPQFLRSLLPQWSLATATTSLALPSADPASNPDAFLAWATLGLEPANPWFYSNPSSIFFFSPLHFTDPTHRRDLGRASSWGRSIWAPGWGRGGELGGCGDLWWGRGARRSQQEDGQVLGNGHVVIEPYYILSFDLAEGK